MNRTTLRASLVAALRADADFQERGLLPKMGKELITMEADCLAIMLGDSDGDLALAWHFWDAWVDERNHGFPGFTENITKSTWPLLARTLANNLEANVPVQDPLIVQFHWHKQPGIFQRIAERLLKKPQGE